MTIVGKREAESDSIALRIRGAGKKQDVMPVADFIETVSGQIKTRALVL
jgi:threonyl-tRNA synthetase